MARGERAPRRRIVAAATALVLGLAFAVPVGIITAQEANAYRAPTSAWVDQQTPVGIAGADYRTVRMVIGSPTLATGTSVMEVTAATSSYADVGISNSTLSATTGSQSSMYYPQIPTSTPAVYMDANANNIDVNTAQGSINHFQANVWFRFNYAVTNPRMHVAGLGGDNLITQKYTTDAVHDILTPGVTFGPPTNNLQVVTGQNGTANTRLQTIDTTGNMAHDAYCTGHYTGFESAGLAGCGTSQLLGSFTTVQMAVTLQKSNHMGAPVPPSSTTPSLTTTATRSRSPSPRTSVTRLRRTTPVARPPTRSVVSRSVGPSTRTRPRP